MKNKLSSALVISSDETANFLHNLWLKRIGLTDHVLAAKSGEEAVRLLYQQKNVLPELILLDHKLVDMNGIDFLEHCSLFYDKQQLAPIIILLTLSAYLNLNSNEAQRLKALPISVTAHLEKPLTPVKLLPILQRQGVGVD